MDIVIRLVESLNRHIGLLNGCSAELHCFQFPYIIGSLVICYLFIYIHQMCIFISVYPEGGKRIVMVFVRGC